MEMRQFLTAKDRSIVNHIDRINSAIFRSLFARKKQMTPQARMNHARKAWLIWKSCVDAERRLSLLENFDVILERASDVLVIILALDVLEAIFGDHFNLRLGFARRDADGLADLETSHEHDCGEDGQRYIQNGLTHAFCFRHFRSFPRNCPHASYACGRSSCETALFRFHLQHDSAFGKVRNAHSNFQTYTVVA